MACLQLTAAVGSITSGFLGDIMGRQRCVRLGAFFYFFTAFIQCYATTLEMFIIGRSLQGYGVGVLSMTVPVIQTEIAAPHKVSDILVLYICGIWILTRAPAWTDGRG